ncbi:T9SS type A sorting domain-containing protein [Aquimarina sp. RZ0]|uniref:T9SS type A sorting domain-containing protein n=1 Tax=Aquimarina sp. RZ0 TaxID=2607730 RepID=UPI0011F0E7AA|nr:T9SS type A sorting domain-containing protein [Aquimarina sp. RZ0]KAA1245384.1 T9SS type A sorting domain-containing protein [Aquimarina sp. RZ0]
MKKNILWIAILLLGIAAKSQVTNDGVPESWKDSDKKSQKELFTIEMPKFDLAKIRAEDAVNDLDRSKVYRFGYEFNVDLGFKNAGTWSELENGDFIWRIRIKSEGAKTLNFVFNEYKLPKGASLYLYSMDKKDLLGAYTHTFNREDGMLGTWMVESGDVIIEYYVPASLKGKGMLNLSKVIHGYRSVTDDDIIQKGLNDSGDCNQDVDCSVGSDFDTLKNDLKRSVALFILGGSTCSGTLINNTGNDRKPYFLSANHCFKNANGTTLSNPSTWAFRFNWVSPNPSCATTTPSTNGSFDQTTSGATLLANNNKSDMLLVNIDSALPDSWNLEWAGWDRTGNTPDFVVGIHHPSGDIMKVCRENQSPTKTAISFNGNSSTEMWRVANWDLGVTEEGSSGSALFDQDGRIIGDLSGGAAACNGTNDNNQFDVYGRFEVSWDFGTTNATRLSNWLDPTNTGRTTLDTYSQEILLSVEDIELSKNIVVYPNPSQGIFTVSNKSGNRLSYDLFTITGQQISSGQLSSESETLNISGNGNGIYFISITNPDNDSITTRKIIVQ